MSSIFCHQCGKQLNANAKFCGGCGASQIEPPVQQAPTPPPVQQAPTPPPVQQAPAPPPVQQAPTPPPVQQAPTPPPVQQAPTPPPVQQVAPQTIVMPTPQEQEPPFFQQEPMVHEPDFTQAQGKGKFWAIGLASALLLTAGIAVVAVLPSLEKADSAPEITTPTLELHEDNSLDQNQSQLPEEETPSPSEPEPEPGPEPEPERLFTMEAESVSQKQIIPQSANASSVLPNWENYTYNANCVTDNNENTAWVEDADGLGIGEWVEVHFPQREEVWEIQLYNGYGDNYYDNGIMSQCAITLSGGERYVFDLSGRWNTLTLPAPVSSSSVRVTILDAHTSHWEDTCISEIKVFGKGEETPATVLTESQLIEQIGGLGDVSGLTPAMAAAFAQAIYQEEIHHKEATALLNQGFSLGYDMDGSMTATLLNGGNGVPVLLIKRSAEYYFDQLCEIQQLYTWDGSSAVRYTTGHEYDSSSKFYFCNVAERNGSYQLLALKSMFGFTGAGNDCDPYGFLYYPLEKGQVVETLDDSYLTIYFALYESGVSPLDSYAYDEFLTRVSTETTLAKLPNFAQTVASSLGSFQSSQQFSSLTLYWIDGAFKGYTDSSNVQSFFSSQGISKEQFEIWEDSYSSYTAIYNNNEMTPNPNAVKITPSQNANELAKLLALYGG